MNSSGKVLIIFIAISAILLVTLTAVSLYFVHIETEKRKVAELALDEHQNEQIKLEEQLNAIEKQNLVLQEKSKEAQAQIIDLENELELEKGLKEEMKSEAAALQEKITALEKEKEEIAKEIKANVKKYDELFKKHSGSEKKINQLTSRLKSEMERSQKLGELYEQKKKEDAKKAEEQKVAQQQKEAQKLIDEEPAAPPKNGIELEEIVIAPRSPAVREPVLSPEIDQPIALITKELEGRILSVDSETEFVIVNLGEDDGLSLGNVLSVYRNENYLGDIKVTRLQSEMSAADLVLPLSIRSIRKNDQVKVR